MSHSPSEQTERVMNLLERASGGNSEALKDLLPLIYSELHDMAEQFLRRERKDHTLQATALINEAFLKLVDQRRVDWQSKTHFLAISAQAMRRILLDHARGKMRLKRGGGRHRVDLDEGICFSPHMVEDVLAVNEALETLEAENPRHAKYVELRFFGGLTVEEVAKVLGVSKRTAEADWTVIRAWLRRELSGDDE